MRSATRCLPERARPNDAHSSRRLPRGVAVKVTISTAVIGMKALSSTLMPACGIATAMPMAIENAIARYVVTSRSGRDMRGTSAG